MRGSSVKHTQSFLRNGAFNFSTNAMGKTAAKRPFDAMLWKLDGKGSRSKPSDDGNTFIVADVSSALTHLFSPNITECAHDINNK